MTARLTLKENILMRLVGLFIFLSPNRGVKFFAEVSVQALEKACELKKERDRVA